MMVLCMDLQQLHKSETPYQTELINETKAVLLGDFNEEGTALTVKIIGERAKQLFI